MNKKQMFGGASLTKFPDFQSVIDWINLVSGLLAAAGILLIIRQMKKEKERDIKEMRPYVHVSLQISKQNRDELEIHIVNVGRTPALNIVVDFEGIQPWCYVRPQTHHFLKKNGGIQRQLPNEYRIYYIGRRKDLPNLAGNNVPITVTYAMESEKKTFTEQQPYNLPGNNFLRSITMEKS